MNSTSVYWVRLDNSVDKLHCHIIIF